MQIYYIEKEDYSDNEADNDWQELILLGMYKDVSKDLFGLYKYYNFKIEDKIFKAPSDEALKLFEQALTWKALTQTRTHLEVLKDFDLIAEEIEADRRKKRNER